jgi:hypothetical protein
VVTPKVHALSMPLFQQQFKLLRPFNQKVFKSIQFSPTVEEIHGATPIIQWVGSPSVFPYYDAVKIGRTIYKVCHLSYFSLLWI